MYYTLSVIGSGGSITFVGCHGPDITGPSTGPDSLSPGPGPDITGPSPGPGITGPSTGPNSPGPLPGPDIALKLEMIYHHQCHGYYLFNCFMVIEV